VQTGAAPNMNSTTEIGIVPVRGERPGTTRTRQPTGNGPRTEPRRRRGYMRDVATIRESNHAEEVDRYNMRAHRHITAFFLKWRRRYRPSAAAGFPGDRGRRRPARAATMVDVRGPLKPRSILVQTSLGRRLSSRCCDLCCSRRTSSHGDSRSSQWPRSGARCGRANTRGHGERTLNLQCSMGAIMASGRGRGERDSAGDVRRARPTVPAVRVAASGRRRAEPVDGRS